MKLDGEITSYLSSDASTRTPSTLNLILPAARRQLPISRTAAAQATADHEMQLAGIGMTGYHIERGARSFAAYVQAMVDALGEGVKPYLKSWYMAVKHDPNSIGLEGMSTAVEVEEYGNSGKPPEDPLHVDS